MPAEAQIFVEYEEVRNRLEQLGLTVELLQEVVRHYAIYLNSQTEDHPTWGRGITPASEAIYALRNILRPLGWSREEEKGFALTIHPNNELAINIAKGDEGTGNPKAKVTSSSEKGICTEEALNENEQYSFDLMVPEVVGVVPKRPTWYLIVRKKADGMHAEFSLPIGLVEKKICEWRERIILPKTSIDDPEISTAGFDDGGFEVKLSRRK